MNIDDYTKLFPTENVWVAGRQGVIQEGMLAFDDSACIFAGPFEGDYAYFRIRDYKQPGDPLLTVAEYRLQRIRFSQYNLPYAVRPKQPIQDEHHLQRLLAKLSARDRRAWDKTIAEAKIEWATVETPFGLYLCGNDDASYTKWFPTLEATQEFLALLLACQPLNFDKDIAASDFIFTN